ncbi:6623_t:CDS:2, partial [Acaulospora colombiana]
NELLRLQAIRPLRWAFKPFIGRKLDNELSLNITEVIRNSDAKVERAQNSKADRYDEQNHEALTEGHAAEHGTPSYDIQHRDREEGDQELAHKTTYWQNSEEGQRRYVCTADLHSWLDHLELCPSKRRYDKKPIRHRMMASTRVLAIAKDRCFPRNDASISTPAQAPVVDEIMSLCWELKDMKEASCPMESPNIAI